MLSSVNLAMIAMTLRKGIYNVHKHVFRTSAKRSETTLLFATTVFINTSAACVEDLSTRHRQRRCTFNCLPNTGDCTRFIQTLQQVSQCVCLRIVVIIVGVAVVNNLALLVFLTIPDECEEPRTRKLNDAPHFQRCFRWCQTSKRSCDIVSARTSIILRLGDNK
jgi:hypothetical protein